jgi:hypothetical protein
MLDLLISFLNSLDTDCSLVPADANLFIEVAIKFFVSDPGTQAVQGATGKPLAEACSDVLTLLLVHLA